MPFWRAWHLFRSKELAEPEIKAELSHRVGCEAWRDGAVKGGFSAGETERAALAARFGIPSVDALRVDYTISAADQPGMARLDGRVRADVTQLCTVTLAPVSQSVDEAFSVMLIDGSSEPEDEDFEALIDGGVDVGEVAAQYLALALDPYPRVGDREIEASPPPGGRVLSEEEARAELSPFAVLKKL